MFIFIAVVICDLNYVFLPLFVVIDFYFVDFNGQNGILLGFMLFLFLVFPGFIERLEILGRSRYRNLSLGLIPVMVFHCSMSLDFVCGDVGWSIPLRNLLVNFLYIRTRL